LFITDAVCVAKERVLGSTHERVRAGEDLVCVYISWKL
jgi:hypothetical protein